MGQGLIGAEPTSGNVALSQSMSTELGRLVRPLMKKHQVPGVAIGLVTGPSDDVACFGTTNVEHQLPVDPDTVFQIASITKVFTVTALLALFEAGRLDLDAPVRTYLPEFQLQDEAATKALTTRHLISHSGGFFGDHFLDTGPGDDALSRFIATFHTLPQLFPPGQMWAANNADFCLAGRLIEVITGLTFETAVARIVLEPLGMKKSFFFAADATTHRFAAGHFVVDGRPVVTRPLANRGLRPIAILPRSGVPTGGLLSTANDMIRFIRSLLGHGSILSPETLELMGAPSVPGAWDQWRGYPWIVRDSGGQRILTHGGGGARSGQRALLSLAPRAKAGVIILTNCGPVGAFVHDSVAEWWLARVVGVSEQLEGFSPTGARVTVRAATRTGVDEFVGAYRSPDTDVTIEHDPEQDGILLLREVTRRRLIGGYETEPPPPPPARIASCGGDRFVVLDGPTAGGPVEFLRDSAGNIVWLWMDHGRIHGRSSPG